jgi:hypothetical protein
MTQNKFHSESGLRYYREFRFFNVTVGISSLPGHGDSEKSIRFLLQNYSKFISFANCAYCLQQIMLPLTKYRNIEVFDVSEGMHLSIEQAVDLVNIACRWSSKGKDFFMTCDAGCGRSGTALLVLKVFEKFFETTGDIDLRTRVEYSWNSGAQTGIIKIDGLFFLIDILAEIHRHEYNLYGFGPSLESEYEYVFVENFLLMLVQARNLKNGECSDEIKNFEAVRKAREIMNLPAIECVSHVINTKENLLDAVEHNNFPRDTTKIVIHNSVSERLFNALSIVDLSDLEIIVLSGVGFESLFVFGCPVLRAVEFVECPGVQKIEISGSLTLKSIGLHKLKELVQFFPDNVCESLKVFNCTQLERLGREGSLLNNTLRDIDLEKCKSLANLGDFPALETMHLKKCVALKSLGNYESLKKAKIENCPLQYIDFQESRGLDNLEILFIKSIQIMLFGIVDFNYLRHYNSFKKIKFDLKKINNDKFYNINEKVYSNFERGNIFLRNSSEVEVIDFPEKDRIEILSCAALEQVEFMRRAKEITIKDCPVIKNLDFRQTHDLQAVILDLLPSLTYLSLDDCQNLYKASVKNCLSLREISITNQ